MRKMSSVKPILYYSLILLTLCAITPLFAFEAQTQQEEADVGIVQDVPQEALDEAKALVERFLTTTEDDIKTAEAIKERSDRITAEAIGAAEEEDLPAAGIAPSPPLPSSLCSSRVYYLISLSMPSDTVQNIVEEALRINGSCKKKVVLVGIRGFICSSMMNTLKKLYKVSSAVKRDLPFTILSKEFKAYDVKEVPFIIVRNGHGEKTLHGDMSIQYAVEKAEDGETAGMMYVSIIEDDFYDMMASKAKTAEARLRSRQYNYDFDLAKYDGRFQKADRDNVFRIDPSHTVESDVKDAKGAVIAKKGTVINPSDYAPLGKYVFIDGNDEKEIEYAISLKPRQIILVSGNPVKLSKKYKRPFYVADDSLVLGLSLTKTPSIIEQDGRFIRVTEKKL